MENIISRILTFIKKHKKFFIILSICIILTIIIISIIEITRNASLTISITPTDSVTTINGKEYHNGTYKFHPGTVTAQISHEGFDSKEVTIELKSHTTTNLDEFLTQGNSLDYYNTHKTDFIALQNIYNSDLYTGDKSSLNNYFENYRKLASIRNQLPITEFIPVPNDPSSKYAIIIKEDSEDCNEPLCLLIIDETEHLHKEALDLIKKRHFNPDDYKIRYSNTGADF